MRQGDAALERKLIEKLESCARNAEAAKKQFNRFRDLCISAQQVPPNQQKILRKDKEQPVKDFL